MKAYVEDVCPEVWYLLSPPPSRRTLVGCMTEVTVVMN